jgi:hypothetical protein
VAAFVARPTERDRDVTPELVLVDPALGAIARSRLPEPDDTLARMESLVSESRLSALAQSAPAPSVLEPSRFPRSVATEARTTTSSSMPARRSVLRPAALVGAAFAGALAMALVGVRIDLGGNPAGADSTALIGTVPVTTTTPATKPPVSPTVPTPAPRKTRPVRPRPAVSERFAWAPTPGASAYHVELFRGDEKVFAADTKRAAIDVPAGWTFAGRSQKLGPGEYRWYVWPVVSGRRASEAVVQAKLVVPRR